MPTPLELVTTSALSIADPQLAPSALDKRLYNFKVEGVETIALLVPFILLNFKLVSAVNVLFVP